MQKHAKQLQNTMKPFLPGFASEHEPRPRNRRARTKPPARNKLLPQAGPINPNRPLYFGHPMANPGQIESRRFFAGRAAFHLMKRTINMPSNVLLQNKTQRGCKPAGPLLRRMESGMAQKKQQQGAWISYSFPPKTPIKMPQKHRLKYPKNTD